MNRMNPISVGDAGRGVLLNFREPASLGAHSTQETRDHAAAAARTIALATGHGIDLEAYLPEFVTRLALVDQELGKGLGLARDKAIETRDRAHVRVEVVNAQLLVTLGNAGGNAMRDQLRDTLPTTTHGHRKDDRVTPGGNPKAGTGKPAAPGPVAAGAAADVAATKDAGGTVAPATGEAPRGEAAKPPTA